MVELVADIWRNSRRIGPVLFVAVMLGATILAGAIAPAFWGQLVGMAWFLGGVLGVIVVRIGLEDLWKRRRRPSIHVTPHGNVELRLEVWTDIADTFHGTGRLVLRNGYTSPFRLTWSPDGLACSATLGAGERGTVFLTRRDDDLSSAAPAGLMPHDAGDAARSMACDGRPGPGARIAIEIQGTKYATSWTGEYSLPLT